MGLDMYLRRVTYLSTYNRPAEVKIEVPGMDHIDPSKVTEIKEEVGYWRKANQIHAWFVANVQGGEDECREHSVAPEQLAELLAVCRQVLADHSLAAELLPTQEGYFFGDTSYDEYYFEDLQHTVDILEPLVGDLVKEEPAPAEEPASVDPEVQEVAEGIAAAMGGGTVTIFEIDPEKMPSWYTEVYFEYQSSW